MKLKVAIIVLVLLLLSGVGTVLLENGMKGSSRRRQATSEVIRKVAMAADRYRSDYGAWPPAADDRPGMIIDEKLLLWIGPYMRTWPDDAWGVPLRYTLSEQPGPPPEIRSAGPDKQFDTQDDLTNR